ncbi:MAG: serine/threonine protein kinase [Lentisphaeria bacterium]|nr:serine/threonine protein kinase [Lentisphaeria bacterium]
MLYCPKCQQLEATTPQKHDDGTVTYRCKKCGGDIPLRRDLRPGEVVAGFEIEEELGRGAMGIVYQARQTNLDREVAIKILSDDSASDEVYVERFFREARAAASLSHPNVVQAYDAGVTEDGIYYFVMEKITGENLELVLNNVGPLNIPQALDVFISVANALSYAWTRNQLSHGDIKPENIIMRLNGKVKLADFGLARRAKDPELADEDIRATPAYAPPEIINGDKDVPGFKSDMYSFGATAYHILIGHEPFIDADPVKVCAMQLSDVQTPLCELNPNIPRRLSDLVDALMEKDPANRPADWSDVVDELKDIQRELNAAAPAAKKKKKTGTGRVPAQSDPVGRKRFPVWAIVVAAVLLVAVIAAIVFGLASNTTDEPGRDVPPSAGGSVSVPSNPASGGKTEPSSVHDEAFYQARWRMIQEESKGSGLELKQVEKFVADAGPKAPVEAVEALAALRAEEKQSRALALRNELLDRAETFKPGDAAEMDFEALDDLYQAALSKRDELKKLDAELTEHIYLPEHAEKVDAYIKLLSDLQLAVSLGGEIPVSTGTKPETMNPDQKPVVTVQTTKPDPAKTEPDNAQTTPDRTEPVKTEPEKVAGSSMDSKLLMNYLLLLDYLPGTIRSESKCAEALRLVNELLADKEFTDESPRKNCLAIRRFLVLNAAPLLPYLDENQKVLRGMKLFPRAYPDSVLDDISGNTFRMKVSDEKASITQRVTWNKLRSDEGEDHVVFTLVNSPQLSKLSEEFREYLFVRALFLGVDPELLVNRFDRASGLSAAKKIELARIAVFFRESLFDLDDD